MMILLRARLGQPLQKRYMSRKTIDSPAALDKLIDTHSGSEPLFLYFVADNVRDTEESWCPDCRAAKAPINHFIENRPKIQFFDCLVGQRDAWKARDHPYRLHPKFKITGVPTLMKWQDGKSVLTLGEADCANPKALENIS